MKRNVRWITETAAMLALLICLQWIGSQIPEQMTKQLVTGSLVNAVLAVTVLTVGYSSGITIGLISPVLAFMLKIAPNLISVIPIMLGNVCFVVLLRLICGENMRPIWRQPVALVSAATAKFAALYGLVVLLAGGIFYGRLAGQKVHEWVLMPPNPEKYEMLMLMFSWPQLATALLGGTVALLIVPVLRKALHR